MDHLFKELFTKKIGEIAIIGPHDSAQGPFIRSICPSITHSQQNILFGNLDCSNDLSLFMYGIKPQDDSFNFSWELIANKLLGFVLLFDWYDEESFESSKKILDFFGSRVEAPILLAADVRERPYPVKQDLFQHGVSLELNRNLIFCSTNDSQSVKQTVISLLNSVICKLP
jgi:uncharacterized protein